MSGATQPWRSGVEVEASRRCGGDERPQRHGGWRRRRASRGPERYLTYARLDVDIDRNQAPLVAFGNISSQDLFSTRMGCQTYGVYGMDLAALCVRK